MNSSEYSAKSPGLRPLLARYAVPGLLILVALGQQLLVVEARISPWKGGGFGMFSTVDDPYTRQLHAHALRQGEAIPVRLDGVADLRPGITGVLTRTRYVPTHQNLEAAARELLTVQWIMSVEEGAVLLRPSPLLEAGSRELADFADTLRLEALARRMQSGPYTVFLEPLSVVELEL